MLKRKRATVIVETEKGILLVSHLIFGKFLFALPGGGIKFKETPEDTARREVEEETGLKLKDVKYLFDYSTLFHKHKVFSAKGFGNLKKSWETRHFAYYGDDIRIGKSFREIIEKYSKAKN